MLNQEPKLQIQARSLILSFTILMQTQCGKVLYPRSPSREAAEAAFLLHLMPSATRCPKDSIITIAISQTLT